MNNLGLLRKMRYKHPSSLYALVLFILLFNCCLDHNSQEKRSDISENQGTKPAENQINPVQELSGKEYGRIDHLMEINGKLAYYVAVDDKILLVYDGRELGKEYDGIDGVNMFSPENYNYQTSVGGKIAYSVLKRGRRIIVYDGIEYGNNYSRVSDPLEVDGKLVYYSAEGIIYDGRIMEVPYDRVDSPYVENGKLCYIGWKDTSGYVVCDGVADSSGYEEINTAKLIKGKMTFRVKKPGQNGSFILYDGKEYGKGYYLINDVTGIGDKIAFEVQSKAIATSYEDHFIFFDGKEIGAGMNPPGWSIVEVDGKLAYQVEDITNYKSVGHKVYIIYDDKKYGVEYARAERPVAVGGKLAYTATNDHRKNFIVFDGKEIGKEYDSADYPMEYKGKLVYRGWKNGTEALVYENREITDWYEGIGEVKEINGKLAFIEKKGDKLQVLWANT